MIAPLWVIAGCQIVLVVIAFRAARKLIHTPGMTGELNKMTNTLNAEAAAFDKALQQGQPPKY